MAKDGTVVDDSSGESQNKKIPYPKPVLLILSTEFCERYAYSGFRAILAIYLYNVLNYEQHQAVSIFHMFSMLSLFFPFIGAAIADSWLGKFRTILYLSLVYAAGNILLSLTATPPLNIPNREFTIVSLVLIAIGSGGIKPCVYAFGADQFVLPNQQKYLESYFHFFYFAINAGALISVFLSPILRRDVHCFDEKTCYPLAFAVPSGLMILAVLFFVVGKPFYTMNDPEGNVLFQKILKPIGYALKQKWRTRNQEVVKESWLDHAEDKFDKKDIQDLKITLRFLKLFIPLPIFWALYAQEGSRWIFQAQQMDGSTLGYIVKPEQMMTANPVLIFAFVPLFDQVIYPLFGKIGMLKKPLQRLVVGGVIAGIAFICSGLIDIELEKSAPTQLHSGQAHLQIVNMLPLEINGQIYGDGDEIPEFNVSSHSNFIVGPIPMGNFSLKIQGVEESFLFELIDNEASTIMIAQHGGRINFVKPKPEESDYMTIGDVLEKSFEGFPFVRIYQIGIWEDPDASSDPDLVIIKNSESKIFLQESKRGKYVEEFSYDSERDWRATTSREIEIHEYKLLVDEKGKNRTVLSEGERLKMGGSYIITIVKDGDNYDYAVNVLTEPNSLHIFWMLPQITLLTVGEVMFMITLMAFSYNQSPESMKSLTQSAWMLTNALGQVIVIIVAESQVFKKQEYFLYAGLMFADMIIFAWLAYRFKPVDLEADVLGENSEEAKTQDNYSDRRKSINSEHQD